uniref:GDT1 family protein n=1 Tax=Timspurckia oligopyrenoides TaxID=708627 RepID=A0A7S0ZKE6_9RHOD|mmetsp:Transcript_8736/g.15773  ORF Transcript_8736/g.15773 Transcript_8736/m.15773 type:complete len:358 (+) Transcript_8736:91-1164(+)|eukprot:CAMPEP_0182447282 /NCGR_PEP_ID=MMETSP1172-20130603/14022_1 /TAXON_ID=708627 /ORGANISM="Timspurckia oligopyrenoides, Strain CCMP3278" /LENGTH=357 /DNA_ID=CAMNT_0024643665 /DNA_START=38 /DNA_END=1111 /DNA_ORIENTATION=+
MAFILTSGNTVSQLNRKTRFGSVPNSLSLQIRDQQLHAYTQHRSRFNSRISMTHNGNTSTNSDAGENTHKEQSSQLAALRNGMKSNAFLYEKSIRKVVRFVLTFIAIQALPSILAPALAVTSISASTTAISSYLDSFAAGLTSSFLLIFLSEIGDKTFFISALLSLKYSKWLVLTGTMGALGLMTIISVLIGQIFHALPASLNTSIPLDDYAAVALLVWFGIDNIRAALSTDGGDEDDGEKRDAEEAIAAAESEKGQQSTWFQAFRQSEKVRVVVETFSLIFVAEWGDKSMLTTIALAAAKSPVGVVLGGVTGHLCASIIAIIGGSLLGKYISERNARLIGGILFLVFAGLTLFGLY